MEHCTPSELMKIEIIKKRFKRPQEIGAFIKIFRDKINHYYDSQTSHIPKDSFVLFIEHIEKFKPPKPHKPNVS